MAYGDLKTRKDRLSKNKVKAPILKRGQGPHQRALTTKLSKEHHAMKKSIKSFIEDESNF